VDLVRGRFSMLVMCLQTGTMQAGGRQVGRLRLELCAAMLLGEREDAAFPVVAPVELIRNVEGLLQWGKGQLCTTWYGATVSTTLVTQENYLSNCWPTSLLVQYCTIETLQTPTAQILRTRRDFVREPSPHLTHHSSRLCH
jgi:hypothetical protein